MKTMAKAQEAVRDIKHCMEMYPEAEVNYIVTAVNSHAELLEALKAYAGFHDEKRYEMPEDNENEGKQWKRIRKMADDAIMKSEGR